MSRSKQAKLSARAVIWQSFAAHLDHLHRAAAHDSAISLLPEQVSIAVESVSAAANVQRRYISLVAAHLDASLQDIDRRLTEEAPPIAESEELTPDDETWLEETSLVHALRSDLAGIIRSEFPVVDPITLLFRSICSASSQIYRDRWPAVHPAPRYSFLNEHPGATYLPGDPYAATAETTSEHEEDIANGSDVRFVRLAFYLEQFGPSTYAGLLYLMAHECVAHVPARPLDRNDGNRSVFAEGFMDWVARFWLAQWLDQMVEPLQGPAKTHCQHLADACEERSRSRCRPRGHAAAEVLVQWFRQQLGLAPAAARLHVAQLGIRLNVADCDPEKKNILVRRLRWGVPHAIDRALRAWHPQSATGVLEVVDAAMTRSEPML